MTQIATLDLNHLNVANENMQARSNGATESGGHQDCPEYRVVRPRAKKLGYLGGESGEQAPGVLQFSMSGFLSGNKEADRGGVAPGATQNGGSDRRGALRDEAVVIESAVERDIGWAADKVRQNLPGKGPRPGALTGAFPEDIDPFLHPDDLSLPKEVGDPVPRPGVLPQGVEEGPVAELPASNPALQVGSVRHGAAYSRLWSNHADLSPRGLRKC